MITYRMEFLNGTDDCMSQKRAQDSFSRLKKRSASGLPVAGLQATQNQHS